MPFTIQSGQSINLNTAAQLAGGTVPLTSFIIGHFWEEDYVMLTPWFFYSMPMVNALGIMISSSTISFNHTSGGVIHRGDDLLGGTIDETVEVHLDNT